MNCMSILQHEAQTGQTVNGEKTYAAAVDILGRIEKNKRINIFVDNEERRFNDILYVNERYTVNKGDKVNGQEVVQEFDCNKFMLA